MRKREVLENMKEDREGMKADKNVKKRSGNKNRETKGETWG